MKSKMFRSVAALLLCAALLTALSACGTSEPASSNAPIIGPTEPTGAPTTPTDPTQPTSAPTDPTSAPTDPTVAPTQPTSTPTTQAKGDDPVDPKYAGTVLQETADAGESYLSDIVFIGDSRTYGYAYYGMLPEGTKTKNVWVPANHTFSLTAHSYVNIVDESDGQERTIVEAAKLHKPKIIIIELGINNVSYITESKFKSVYGELIQNIKAASPDTKIICNSIYCVCRSYKKQDVINNTLIYRANGWLMDVAYENGVKYLDTVSMLKDSEGYLPEEYESGDGLHLNTKAYRAILQYIRTHAYL